MIRERISQQGGRITFRDYMELALYHPQWGYYTAGKVKIGSKGDFTTSPEASPAFGAALARFVVWCDQELGEPAPFTLSEYGAGSGRLMVDLLDALREAEPGLYGRLAVRIVETSPALIERQQAALQDAGHGAIVTWSDRGAGVGLVLSNEVPDAFPVARVAMRDGELREIYVGVGENGDLIDIEDTPSTPELAEYFEQSGRWPVVGQRTEVNLAALRWLEDIAADLERGFVLTIDYGDTAERLYSSLRPEGTFMSYAAGRVTDNPYAAPGEMDMTAHVDFSALMRRGAEVDLQTVWLKRQMEFLVEHGLGEMIAGLMGGPSPASMDDYQALMAQRDKLFRLIDPDGLGRFYVLLQRKGSVG